MAASFKPDQDIGDLSGKTIIVTGGNIGLGKASVLALAKHNPARIYLAARSESKAQEAIDDIKEKVPNAAVHHLKLDLASFESIAQAVQTFHASSSALHILMNNAAIMASPPALTQEGYEIQFGTNHMGHALFTKLLLPTLQKTAAEPDSDVRIINLTSRAAVGLPPKQGMVLEEAKTEMQSYSPWVKYGHSKLANILFTKELARRYPGIKSVAVHPGTVKTALVRGAYESYPWLTWWWIRTPLEYISQAFMKTPDDGALNQLWAATSKDAQTGTYVVPVGVVHPGGVHGQDADMAVKLWEWTESELAAHGY